ncbi:MAG: ABC transporter permease [Gallionella sp.]|jgi:phospholipid/cholesterol/gamma-HCH transport system permease protein
MSAILRTNPIATIGHVFLLFLSAIGRVVLFTWHILSEGVRGPYYYRQFGRMIIEIGYFSLPVIGLTTLFTGAALALQSYSGFSDFGAESSIPLIVALAITRELGPVMGGLMVAGRIGAAFAAEIGTMRVTEQIDALVTLSTNPYKYLLFPRVLAAALMLPCLVFVGDIIGIFGGYAVSVKVLGFHPVPYINNTWNFLTWYDVNTGLVKAAVFGFIVALMGCYHGYHSKGGAQGVGAATTNAVVSASILILLANYMLTEMFFSL